MKLNVKSVAALRYQGKASKHYDGQGLYLHVTSTARTWRYSFRLNGKPSEYTIGDAETLSLAKARAAHRDAREKVQSGLNPVIDRRQVKQAKMVAVEQVEKAAVTFGQRAEQWIDSKQRDWASSHYDKQLIRIKGLAAWFKDKPLLEIEPKDVVAVLSAKLEAGKAHSVHKQIDIIRQVLEQCVAEGFLSSNPCTHPLVKSAIGKRPTARNYAFITDERVLADVLKSIDYYNGNEDVRAALRLLPMLFTRPTELRTMQWDELDLESGIWNIPEHRMKERRAHVVPLPTQAIEILKRQRARLPDDAIMVFPGKLSPKQAISDNTLNTALKRMGIGSDVIVPHGFRHTASTLLNDGRATDADGNARTFSADAIELQLSHSQGGVRGVYNKAQRIEERKGMMQAWADWLDAIKEKVG